MIKYYFFILWTSSLIAMHEEPRPKKNAVTDLKSHFTPEALTDLAFGKTEEEIKFSIREKIAAFLGDKHEIGLLKSTYIVFTEQALLYLPINDREKFKSEIKKLSLVALTGLTCATSESIYKIVTKKYGGMLMFLRLVAKFKIERCRSDTQIAG